MARGGVLDVLSATSATPPVDVAGGASPGPALSAMAGPDGQVMRALGVIPWWEIVRLALGVGGDPRAALVNELLATPAGDAIGPGAGEGPGEGPGGGPAEPGAGVPPAFLDWLNGRGDEGGDGMGIADAIRQAYRAEPGLAARLYQAARAIADEAPDLLPPDLRRAVGGGASPGGGRGDAGDVPPPPPPPPPRSTRPAPTAKREKSAREAAHGRAR
jgi:hypothetical protein